MKKEFAFFKLSIMTFNSYIVFLDLMIYYVNRIKN